MKKTESQFKDYWTLNVSSCHLPSMGENIHNFPLWDSWLSGLQALIVTSLRATGIRKQDKIVEKL